MSTVTRLATVGLIVLTIHFPAMAAAADEVMISIGDRLDPAEVTVPAGSAVTWRNDDGRRHRVRGRDGAAEFDSGNLDPGESFTYAFEVPGDHPYADERDPDDPAYHGLVTVTDGGRPAVGTSAVGVSGDDQQSSSSPAADGPAGEDGAPSTADVAILDRSFSPASVTIAPGATVTWSNRSDRDHTVTFRSGGGSGQLGPGASFTQTFDAPGTFDYLCAIHPEMTATVVVQDAGGDADVVTDPGGPTSPPDSIATPAAATASSTPEASSGSATQRMETLASGDRFGGVPGLLAAFVVGIVAGVAGSRVRRR